MVAVGQFFSQKACARRQKYNQWHIFATCIVARLPDMNDYTRMTCFTPRIRGLTTCNSDRARVNPPGTYRPQDSPISGGSHFSVEVRSIPNGSALCGRWCSSRLAYLYKELIWITVYCMLRRHPRHTVLAITHVGNCTSVMPRNPRNRHENSLF